MAIPSRSLLFVTGNANKLTEVQQILGSYIPITSIKLDLPELQGETYNIAYEKVKIASKLINGSSSIIVEDTCLCFNALNGLPGPYIKWFLEKCGHEGLNKMLVGFEDKTAYALCTFAYQESIDSEPIIFEGRTNGRIVNARGDHKFGWDPIFLPDGFDKTYAELDRDTKNSISHRGRALAKLKDFLANKI